MALALSLPPTYRQIEPQVIASGSAVEWYRGLTGYSATDWTFHYVIRSNADVYTFAATNSGGMFFVSLTSAVTATWKPGQYAIGAYVTSGSDQVQIRTAFSTLTVGPNLAVAPAGVDVVPWAVKMLASIEDTIAKLTGRTVETASVNGSAYTLANINDLYLLRLRFKSEVRQLEDQARLNAGLGAQNKIGVRFRSLAQTPWSGLQNVPWQ